MLGAEKKHMMTHFSLFNTDSTQRYILLRSSDKDHALNKWMGYYNFDTTYGGYPVWRLIFNDESRISSSVYIYRARDGTHIGHWFMGRFLGNPSKYYMRTTTASTDPFGTTWEYYDDINKTAVVDTSIQCTQLAGGKLICL